jgi:predicted membrane protein
MNDMRSRSNVIAPQLIIGFLLLVAGVVLLLDNFGVLHAHLVLRYWPTGLMLIGIAVMAQAQRAAGRVSGLVWVFVGGWLLLGNLGILRLNIFDLWPIPIVLIGGYLIWQAIHGPETPADRQRESHFSALAVMGGVGRKINSQQFTGGEATALLGGVKIDLHDATIAADEAVIDVFAFWGGIELSVPEGWAVINRVVALLGGADDRTRPPTNAAAKRLIIRGICVMGGVEIKTA